MKKIGFLTIGIILFFLIFLLNIKVTMRQGINYKVQTLKIPLYLKVLDFYDRHCQYKWLVYKITEAKRDEKDRIMALFKWTNQNIREQPKELPVVDDHVWHIIVRGYGTGDQHSDVFTTLCNYAGNQSFFYRLTNKDNTSRITLSFVKIQGRWCLFDPRQGIYFLDRTGSFAAVKDLLRGDYREVSIGDPAKPKPDYSQYFSQLYQIDCDQYHYFSRANIQSPLNRLIYGIKKHYLSKILIDR